MPLFSQWHLFLCVEESLRKRCTGIWETIVYSGSWKEAPINAVLSGLWTYQERFTPYGFFRLFCTSRTCTPNPRKVPFLYSLEQRASSNHAHSRGYFYSHWRLVQKAYQCNNSQKLCDIPANYMTYLKYQIGEILTFVGQNANPLAK